jgi:hypothetical protein
MGLCVIGQVGGDEVRHLCMFEGLRESRGLRIIPVPCRA